MTSPYSQPLRGDQFDASDWDGHLILFFPTEYLTSIPTQHGETAAVDTHVVGLSKQDPATGAHVVLRDARIFGRALVPQLKGAVGSGVVLGRLGRGQNTKGNPPWILLDHTADDAALADKWFAQNTDPRKAQAPAPPTGGGYSPPATGSPWDSVGSAPAAAPAADNGTAQFLSSKGIDTAGMSEQQMQMIAATFTQ